MAPPLSDEERAAIKVQALVRGRSGRTDFALVRDEEACRQWITYYVALGQFEDAEELGWDGVDPAPPTKEELEANVATMEVDEGSKADAPSETTQQGASTRGERLYEEATRSSASKEAEKATVLSPRWLAQVAQNAAGAVVGAGGGLLAAAGSPLSSSAKQIRAATVVQTWARVLLARAAVRTERRAQAEADLKLAQLERPASIIQGAWAHKKAGQRSAATTPDAEREQRAAVLVQSWARVLLAKDAAYHQERQLRLLAFFTHIEDKKASIIQRAFRAARARAMQPTEARGAARAAAMAGGVGGGIVPVLGAQAEGGMAYTGGMAAVLSSGALLQEQGQPSSPSVRAALAPSASANQLEDATGKPRFGEPPSGLPLSTELQGMVQEIALRQGATLMRRVSRQAIKHDLHNSLKGVLWKRNHNMPRFQRRAIYVTPMYAEGPPALCYVGPPPHNIEKQIPLASISSVVFESERRLEFSIDATSRKHKLVLRADDEKECFLWIDGISLLLSLSDYADYVPL